MSVCQSLSLILVIIFIRPECTFSLSLFLSPYPCVRSQNLSSHIFPFKCTICMFVLGKNTETKQEGEAEGSGVEMCVSKSLYNLIKSTYHTSRTSNNPMTDNEVNQENRPLSITIKVLIKVILSMLPSMSTSQLCFLNQ